MDVIRRMEESRAQHNRQWQEDRAASVLGDVRRSPTRSYSRTEFTTPLHPRSATSMSNPRGDRAPQTAPVDRFPVGDGTTSLRALRFGLFLAPRLSDRRRSLAQCGAAHSLGMRSNTSRSLDIASASTEHGRLLFEAFRALELKLPAEVVSSLPDLMRSFPLIDARGRGPEHFAPHSSAVGHGHLGQGGIGQLDATPRPR